MPHKIRIVPVSEAAELQDPPVANPFHYNAALHSTCCQFLKMVIVGLILFPARLIFCIIFFLLAWLTGAFAACCASSSADGKAYPISMPISRFFMRIWCRCLMFCFGYWWVCVDGTYDADAPVVVANHSSFMDIFFFAYRMLPMAVAKAEVLQYPFIGSVAKALQTIPVQRENSGSRHQVADEINRRTQWKEKEPKEVRDKYPDWPPLLIFPEATCTNTACIIQFKVGAFCPGMPVQPVCLSYKQNYLDVAWVGSCNVPVTMLRMMCQVYNRLHVTYLPVAVPTAEEKADGHKFAERVRRDMAACLNVPLTNHNFLDTLLAKEAHLLRLPESKFNLGMGSYPDGLDHAKQKLKEFAELDTEKTGFLGPAAFGKLLGFEDTDENQEANQRITEAIIAQWDRDGDGRINFREFLLFSAWRKVRREHTSRLSRQGSGVCEPVSPAGSGTSGLSSSAPLDEASKEDQELKCAIALCFGAFDENHDGKVSKEEFLKGVQRVAETLSEEELSRIFDMIDTNHNGEVDIDEYMKYAEQHPYLICTLLNALEAPGDGISAQPSVVFEAEDHAAGAVLP